MNKMINWLGLSIKNKVIFVLGCVVTAALIVTASVSVYQAFQPRHEHTVDYKYECNNDGTHNRISYCTDEDGLKCEGFKAETKKENCAFNKKEECKYCGYHKQTENSVDDSEEKETEQAEDSDKKDNENKKNKGNNTASNNGNNTSSNANGATNNSGGDATPQQPAQQPAQNTETPNVNEIAQQHAVNFNNWIQTDPTVNAFFTEHGFGSFYTSGGMNGEFDVTLVGADGATTTIHYKP